MNRNDQFGPIFALAARFASEIAGMNLPTEVIQKAKEQKNHPLWTVVNRALSPDGNPNPISDETSLVLSRRFTLFIDSLRLPEGVAAAATKDDHPLWAAVKGALLPEKMPMSPGLELGAGKAGETKVLLATPASEVFNPTQKFVVNTSDSAPVKIGSLDDNFRRWMLQMLSSVTDKGGLSSLILPNQMFDRDIVERVGGVRKAIVSLEEVWGEMTRPITTTRAQRNRLIKDRRNIFYVPQAVNELGENYFSYTDLETSRMIEEVVMLPQSLFRIQNRWFVLRAVRVFWSDGGWHVFADSVGHPDGRSGGNLVFSRNSALRHFETLQA